MRLNCTLFVWRTIRVKQIPPCGKRACEAACPAIASATAEAAQQEGVLCTPYFLTWQINFPVPPARRADLFVRLNCTLFVWRTIRVKQNPPVPRTSAAQLGGTIETPLWGAVFDGSPLPPSCDWSPVKNRPVLITGELFPGDTKERSVKQKSPKRQKKRDRALSLSRFQTMNHGLLFRLRYTCKVQRNSALVLIFFSLAMISSMASTGGTPFIALRRIHIFWSSPGSSSNSSLRVPDASMLMAG